MSQPALTLHLVDWTEVSDEHTTEQLGDLDSIHCQAQHELMPM